MGIVFCRSKCSAHGPLEVMLPKPWGVGRLDHYSLEENVRADVIRIIERDFMGLDTDIQDHGPCSTISTVKREQQLEEKMHPKIHPMMEWVLGDELWDAERLRFVNNFARMIWEETVDYCGGLAMGMRDSTGQLGAVAFVVPIEPNMRSTLLASAWRCHFKYKFWFPWRKLGSSRAGVQARMRNFHTIRYRHFGPNVDFLEHQSVLAIRVLVGQGPERENIQKLLLQALCYYADQRNAVVVAQCSRPEKMEIFEALDFEVAREIETEANDPEKRDPFKVTDVYRKCQWPPCQPDF